MKRVYECPLLKKGEAVKILEKDPYAEWSFAKMGYKTKEGATIGEDKETFYLHLSGEEADIKKAEEAIKGVFARAKPEIEKKIVELVEKEEENAAEGFGGIFG
jgi:hypothetical protein